MSYDHHMVAAPEKIWEMAAEIVTQCDLRQAGLQLFDIELSGAGSLGMLRVYLWSAAEGGVLIEDCARVSKRITERTDIDDLLPGDWTVEVSSPGINRRLRRPEHFQNALGERVKITVSGNRGRETVRGKLLHVDEAELTLEREGNEGGHYQVKRSEVQQAHIDFDFS